MQISGGDAGGIISALLSSPQISNIPVIETINNFIALGKQLEPVIKAIGAASSHASTPALRLQFISLVARNFTRTDLVNKYGFSFSDSMMFKAREFAASTDGSPPPPPKKATKPCKKRARDCVGSFILEHTRPSANRTVKIPVSQPQSQPTTPETAAPPLKKKKHPQEIDETSGVVNQSKWKLTPDTVSQIAKIHPNCKILSVNESGSCQFAAVGALLDPPILHDQVRQSVVQWLKENGTTYLMVYSYLNILSI
jgi:hypothetical protein